ncbi:hypothetical protein V6x_29350 [Gimesia chilikensis]|uniref:Uncharacterized protein n=1 Tax=Gimesia chilikensis TaxID=2605989 RepID=A0A517WD83_9PLAN|nr:hypothetical protein V6x_29350 [Gimesia chilikensis]
MLIDGYDFVERRLGVKRELCFEYFGKCSEYFVSCLRNRLNVLRNDLKSYETGRTDAGCSGEKLEKSTAIQVNPGHLSVVFRCTHRPPRARSTIATLYDSESDDQVQSVHVLVRQVQ